MKLPGETWLPRLIVIVPLVTIAVLTTVIACFYADRFKHYFEEESGRYLKEYTEGKKKQGVAFVGDLKQLFIYKNNRVEEEMEASLKERVGIAFETAAFIYEKYHGKRSDAQIKQQISDALERMVWHQERNYVWITDYEGNSILDGNQQLSGENISSYTDADGRAIILEEIQKVRRDGEGFLRTRFREGEGEQVMFVKDFGHFDWFFGSALQIDGARDALKASLRGMIQEMPTDKTVFTAILDTGGQPVHISEGARPYLNEKSLTGISSALKEEPLWHDLGGRNALVYSDYFAPFGWYLLYGFETTHFTSELDSQLRKRSEKVDADVLNIAAATAVPGLLIVLALLFFTRRIKALFAEYSEEVRVREELLRELNATMERRVREEVEAQREKEKIQIQRSKMAAMGEMLSMIAHQWRQPLNQLSSLFVNISGAYAKRELTQKYLDEKMEEGTHLLERMSKTIDDSEDFFKPDRAREEVVIADVVAQTLPLIEKSLEARKITLQYLLDCNVSIKIFRNELMQVILNVINNAKDALLERKIANPRIMIETVETGQFVIIKVCDNAGGIDDTVKDRIFEPYFSTKGVNGGGGLGLYMSKTIMEARLNGELRFENGDEGACFLIKIGKHQLLKEE